MSFQIPTKQESRRATASLTVSKQNRLEIRRYTLDQLSSLHSLEQTKELQDKGDLFTRDNFGTIFLMAIIIYKDVWKTAIMIAIPCAVIAVIFMFISWGVASVEKTSQCGINHLGSITIATFENKNETSILCSGTVFVNTIAFWVGICIPCMVFIYATFSVSLIVGRPYPTIAILKSQKMAHILFFLFYVVPLILAGLFISEVFFYFGELVPIFLAIPWFIFVTKRSKKGSIKNFTKCVQVKSQEAKFDCDKHQKRTVNSMRHKKHPPWLGVSIIILVTIFYIVVLIPYFRVSSDEVKAVIRLVVHPIIKAVIEAILRGHARARRGEK